MRSRALLTAALAAVLTWGWPGALQAQEEETATNNLAVPVIFADGKVVTLPGVFGTPVWGGEYYSLDGVNYYLQGDPLNSWQAQTDDPTTNTLSPFYLKGPVGVSWVDWGDNLESKAWYSTSVVRIETALYKDLTTPMTGFEMGYLWGDGTTEMWGANKNTYDAVQAMVYTGAARLVIQKLTSDPSSAQGTWNGTQWTGNFAAPIVNAASWSGTTGQGGYGAEINISGKLVYGYNWNVRTTAGEDAAGYYRITFVIDPAATGVTVNTTLSGAQVLLSTETTTEETTSESGGSGGSGSGGTGAGGVAVIDGQHNLTYIDVQILEAKGRKGGSGGSAITATTITPDLTAPQPTGTSVTFTADTTGGVGKVQYKFFVFDGTNWNVAQDWSTSDKYVWTPSTANDAYFVGVWARSQDSTLDAPETSSAYVSVAFPIGVTIPIRASNITANLPAPQNVGTPVTFTASASGGTAPYQYKWWVLNGAWQVLSDWSSSNSITWTPTAVNPGNRVGVWVRSAGNTSDSPESSSAYVSIPYSIGGIVVNSITPSAASGVVGSPVTFTVAATGGSGSYQYKYLKNVGGVWTALTDYVSSNSYAWTPAAEDAGSGWFGVWVRQTGDTTDVPIVSSQALSIPFVVAAQ